MLACTPTFGKVGEIFFRSLRSRILFCTPHFKIRGAAHVDAELVEAVIVKMLRGKTAGLWSYSGQHSHPLLSYVF